MGSESYRLLCRRRRLWVKVGPSTIYARCPDYPLQADLRASSPLVSEVPGTDMQGEHEPRWWHREASILLNRACLAPHSSRPARTRPTGALPRARAIDQSAHRHHQSDPRPSVRAGCRCAARPVLPGVAAGSSLRALIVSNRIVDARKFANV
jgi:hypothetical protein